MNGTPRPSAALQEAHLGVADVIYRQMIRAPWRWALVPVLREQLLLLPKVPAQNQ